MNQRFVVFNSSRGSGSVNARGLGPVLRWGTLFRPQISAHFRSTRQAIGWAEFEHAVCQLDTFDAENVVGCPNKPLWLFQQDFSGPPAFDLVSHGWDEVEAEIRRQLEGRDADPAPVRPPTRDRGFLTLADVARGLGLSRKTVSELMRATPADKQVWANVGTPGKPNYRFLQDQQALFNWLREVEQWRVSPSAEGAGSSVGVARAPKSSTPINSRPAKKPAGRSGSKKRPRTGDADGRLTQFARQLTSKP